MEDDGNWYLVWSMGQGKVTDFLTIHFYNCDEQLIGDIVYKKK